jgi:hypothetical protein
MYDPSPDDGVGGATVAGVVVLLAGVAVAAARFWGEAAPLRGVEAAVGAVAFGAVVAAPGVLALLSRHGRPVLALPAAVLLVPLSFLSFALVTLPLLIPAFLLVRRYARSGAGDVRDVPTTVGVLLLLLCALLCLFANDDARTWATATSSGGTSDVVTYVESVAALLLVAGAIAGGWWASRPAQPMEKPQITSE